MAVASAGDLLAQDLPAQDVPAQDVPAQDVPAQDVPATDGAVEGVNPVDQASTQAGPQDTARGQAVADNNDTETEAPLSVYGDAACGAGALLAKLEAAGADIMTKVQPPVAPGGRFPKDAFTIDPGAGTVTYPPHRPHQSRQGPRWDRGFRDRLRQLPAGGAVHDLQDWAHDQHRRLRSRADPGPDHPARPGLAGAVPGHQAEGGTQARAPDARPVRRAASQGPRPDQGRRRLLTPCSRNESGPVRRARTYLGSRATVDSGHQLNPPGNP